MSELSSIEWWVLNETQDDIENLEQIYQALSPSLFLLSDIADAIQSLVERKLLIIRADSANVSATHDLSYVWRAWFEISPEGQAEWLANCDRFNRDETLEAAWEVDLARRTDEMKRGVDVGEPTDKVLAELRGYA